MRVLLSTYGSRGDVEPLAGLAVALKRLGVEAVVSAPADQEFVELLARADVAYAPACMPIRQWIDEARQNPQPISAYAKRLAPLQYKAIDAVAEDCDVIVSTGLFPSAAAAQCVAEKRGALHAHVAFCPMSLPSEHHPPFARPGAATPEDVTDNRALWALNAAQMQEMFGEAVNGVRETVGLPIADDVRTLVTTTRPLLACDPALWPWAPTDLCDAVQTGAWSLEDARTLAPEITAFLEAGPPPIYVGFGSIALPSTREAALAALHAIRARGQRAILAGGWADNALPDDGADCLAIGEVNQQALFRRVAAVVHHGGGGTTTTAAHAGAAQIIAPQIVDQPFWAAHVAALGAGVALDSASPDATAMHAALEVALSPDMQARAHAVAAAMTRDGATVAAQFLIELAETA